MLPNESRLNLYQSSGYEQLRHACVKSVLQRFLPRPGLRVLEIGAGMGVFTRHLLAAGASAVLVEPSQERVEFLQKSFQENPNVKVVHDFFPLKASPSPPDAPHDVVVALEVIEHVEDPAEFLRACNEALRPGGHLILSTPNRLSLESVVHLAKYAFLGRVFVAGDPTHRWIFTSGQLRRRLRAAGFKVSYQLALQFGCGDTPGGKIPGLPLYFRRFQRSASWPGNRLGFNLLVVAEKIAR